MKFYAIDVFENFIFIDSDIFSTKYHLPSSNFGKRADGRRFENERLIFLTKNLCFPSENS